MKINKKQLLISIAALFFACSEKDGASEHVEEERIPVEVMTVKKKKFTEETIYFGKLEPVQTSDLICYSGGRVERINAQEGDTVKKGKSLAQIDASKAFTELETARVQHDIEKSTLEQTKKHLQNGNASQLAVDKQTLSFFSARSTLINAQKNYRSAFAISPINGIVTKKHIERFQEIPPNSITFTVSRLDTLKIEIGITESDIYYINTGCEAELSIPMEPNRKWKGKIRYLARAAGEEDRVFSAEAFFDNRDNSLKPGTSAQVEIALISYDSTIVIPTNAIITEGVQNSVMSVDSSGIVNKKYIITGPQSDNETMVKSGLSVGDRIITAGFQLVREGTPVIVKKSG